MIKLSAKLIRTPLALSVAAVISSMSPTVAEAGVKLEEIVVTATKTDEMMSDVPISLSVVTGADVEKYNIQRFEDMTPYVPNFQLTAGGIGNVINIRGIASGNQAGFEQSVGTFIDGVFRGRGVQSRFAFLDIGSIEVLRGPQGTLFGKNTVAGALNIRSAKPTEDLTASLKVSHNIDHDETEYTGVVSGAMSDSVRGRLAVMTREMKEGWSENEFYGDDTPQTDEWAARGTIEWDVTDATVATFKLEHGDWDNAGSAAEVLEAGPLAGFGIQGGLDNKANIGALDPVLDVGSDRLFEGDLDEYSLNIEHYMDNYTLTAILGYSEYQFERRSDVDFTPLSLVRFDEMEEQEQSSFEFRIASDLDGDLQFITGLYYQEADLLTDGLSYIGLPTAYGLVSAGCAGAGAGPYASAAQQSSCGQQAAIEGMGAQPGGGAPVPGIARYAYLEQETETWAAFTQFTWSFAEDFRTILGLRYSEEEKTATQSASAVDYISDNRTAPPSTGVPIAALGGMLTSEALTRAFLEFTPHTLNDDVLDRSEESFTWSLSGQWDVSPDTMAYATASTGFKSGGFNSFYMGTNADEAQFDEEEAITFEIGSKMSLLDGAAELNISIFRTEYDDLQVSVFSGNTTFDVKNAAEATTQGIEIDGRWQASESLLFSGSIGWTDFEYDNFTEQACTAAQFSAWREVQWAGGSNPAAAGLKNSDCSAAGVNDLSGETSAQTPELTATILTEYTQELGDLRLVYSADVIYLDEVYRQDDLDPVLLADSVTKVNASIRLSSSDDMWEIALIGKNITDEDQDFTWGNDIPLVGGAYYAETQPGANYTVAATLRY